MQMKISKCLTRELGLALSLMTVMAFAGCGGSSESTTSVSVGAQMGGARQGVPLSLTTAVSTFAGTGVASALDNTVGMMATFNGPDDVTTDGTNLYVVDLNNHKIRKIVIATGAVTTFAGSGAQGSADNIVGTSATFNYPRGITTDGTNLYVADNNSHKIRKIVIASGVVSTLAGSGASGSADNPVGTSATFGAPFGITTDGKNIYVSDWPNHKIRKIVIATGEVTTFAGSGAASAVNDTGTLASFNYPYGITTDGINLYVADSNNNKIRKIVIATGAVTTLAGSGVSGAADNPIGTLATFGGPQGITTDGTNLYVTNADNTIRKIGITSGAVTTLAGDANLAGGAADNLIGTLATFSGPIGLTTDGKGLYVSDLNNNKIRKIK